MQKTVTFRVKELYKEGVGPTGKPWAKYQYYGDDGEHYILFDNLDIEKPYQLDQKETVGKDGKVYKNWFVVKDSGGTGGKAAGGVKMIMDRLEGLSGQIADIHRILEQVEAREEKKIDASLPF